MEDEIGIFYFKTGNDADVFQRDIDGFIGFIAFPKSVFLVHLKKTVTESRLDFSHTWFKAQ